MVYLPKSLFRYRSLQDLKRELDCLETGYVWASSPQNLNDPMEEFFHFNQAETALLDRWFDKSKVKIQRVRDEFVEFFHKSGSVSFSDTFENLPLWAYYANSFEGMCVEYDPARLMTGRLRGQEITKVRYQANTPKAFSLFDVRSDKAAANILPLMTTKHRAWEHEKEWRIVTGAEGKMYFLPEAIKSVIVGPKVDPEAEELICSLGRQKQFEVYKLKLEGFSVSKVPLVLQKDFSPVIPIVGFDNDPRVQSNDLDEIRKFIVPAIDELYALLAAMSAKPNFHSFNIVTMRATLPPRLYVGSSSIIGNGETFNDHHYFDRNLKRVIAGKESPSTTTDKRRAL